MLDRVVTAAEFLEAIALVHENAGPAWDLFRQIDERAIECERFVLQISEAQPVTINTRQMLALAFPVDVRGGFHAVLRLDPDDPLGVRWSGVEIASTVTFLSHPPGFESRDAYNASVQRQLERDIAEKARRENERAAMAAATRLRDPAQRAMLTDEERQMIANLRLARKIKTARARRG